MPSLTHQYSRPIHALATLLRYQFIQKKNESEFTHDDDDDDGGGGGDDELFPYDSADATAIPKPHRSFASFKSRLALPFSY